MCAISNGWTEKIKNIEWENKQLKDEIRILKLRLATAKKILDDIAEMAIRIN